MLQITFTDAEGLQYIDSMISSLPENPPAEVPYLDVSSFGYLQRVEGIRVDDTLDQVSIIVLFQEADSQSHPQSLKL